MKSMEEMLQAAQQAAETIQKQMNEAQAKLDSLEVEGVSGGGLVKVTMTAKGALKGIRIDPSLMVPDEREILEDLIVAAAADARGRSERVMQERMAEVTKGLPIPPGMKLF